MDFELYKRLWKTFIGRYKKFFVLAIFMSIAVGGLTAAIAWMIKPALDYIFIDKNKAMLFPIAGGVLGLYFLKGVFAYIQGYLMAYIGQNVVTDIRNNVYRKIIYLPIPTYNKMTSGVLSARVFYEVNVLQRIVAGTIKETVQQVFTIISLTCVIFMRDWKLALIAMTVLPATGILIKKMGHRIKKLVHEQNELTGDVFGFLTETLTSPRIIKSFRAEEKEAKSFEKINSGLLSIMMRVAKIRSLSSPLMEFIGSIGIAAIILYGGYQVMNGVTTPGNFFSFMGALIMFYAPIKALSNVSNIYHLAMVSAERIFEVIDMYNEEDDIYDTSKKELDGVKDNIKYKNVHFTYEGVGSETLKDVSLDIKAGEMVAFVGGSGAGKTTLVNMLTRFYDVTEGSVSIDGVDIKDYRLGSLRDNISIVTQDVMLFNETLRYNIDYGITSASEDDIVNAAKAAYAHDFIMDTEEGYDTMIGEKGTRLSGGEKQRIAIARAILKDAPILILDEATSSLDSESEQIVQKALNNLMKGKTTLVIAHRLSTVRNADRIVVVESGRVVETGSHTELIEQGGTYKKLHDMQYFVEEDQPLLSSS